MSDMADENITDTINGEVPRHNYKPDAVSWLITNHPALTDDQISKLIGTTKVTIQTVREHTHWNWLNIMPRHPVSVGLCTNEQLDAVVVSANDGNKRAECDGNLVNLSALNDVRGADESAS
jgi:hypothetical protein